MKRFDKPGWWLALCAGLICLAFWPVLNNGFVNWDDPTILLTNPHYRGLAPANLKWMFTSFHMGHFQPLTWLSLGLDYEIWGMNPRGYHLTSLLLHAGAALSFFALLLALLRRLPGAQANPQDWKMQAACFVSTLLFALHPLRVESVAWATERRDVLSGLFYILTLLAYVRATATPAPARWKWLALATAAFAASLLSKAMGTTLFLVLLLLDGFPLQRWPGGRNAEPWRRLLMEKVPFLVLAAGMSLVSLRALHQTFPNAHTLASHPLERLGIMGQATLLYVVQTLMPLQLSPLYLLTPDFNPARLLPLLCIAGVMGLTLGALLTWRRAPGRAAAWFGFLLILAPVSGWTQHGPQWAADRYTYLATLPFAVLAAAGLRQLLIRHPARSLPLLGGGLVLLAGLGTLTARQAAIWRDSITLWNHALALNPDNFIALNNRGNAQRALGRLEEALADENRAIALSPNLAPALGCRAAIYHQLGRTNEALADFSASIRARYRTPQESADIYANRGLLLFELGQRQAALADFQEAFRVNPNCAEAYLNRASLHIDSGALDLAAADLQQLLTIQPQMANAFATRSKLKEAQRDLPGALADLDRAITLNPADARFLYSRALIQRKLANPEAALADYTQAVALRPGYTDAWYNRANLHLARTNYAQAIQDYAAALAANSNYHQAYNNCGNAWQGLTNYAAAITNYDAAIRLQPRYYQALGNRGSVLLTLGRKTEAARDLQAALEIAPSNWTLRATLQRQLQAATAAGR